MTPSNAGSTMNYASRTSPQTEHNVSRMMAKLRRVRARLKRPPYVAPKEKSLLPTVFARNCLERVPLYLKPAPRSFLPKYLSGSLRFAQHLCPMRRGNPSPQRDRVEARDRKEFTCVFRELTHLRLRMRARFTSQSKQTWAQRPLQ